ncbi:hypothetical protein [Desulfurivibrio dismutans]|uniref:hypothetical protein n=1 Tax=Desulfurivibrio dismutans TaxID=1398908 RepID=UPI0023DA4CF4|nr:hypothetical protein [Desulfurivibrio alkaliphilus]MDF1613396.1 hypothetical protein [Desulfurivibrio alkaliphilus]
MSKATIIMAFLALLLIVPGGPGVAAAEIAECRQMASPVTGDERRYSVVADIYGVRAYPDIACAVHWRNHELCATELSTFQFTAKVFDYHSGAEVLMTEAYYVVAVPGESRPLAFVAREEAEEFVAGAGGGELLDYDALVDYPL